MSQVFPYANIVAGLLVLVVGFIFHWIGQLISILNWELATRIGLQEKGCPQSIRFMNMVWPLPMSQSGGYTVLPVWV